jgi:UDP-glucose 4-epimerase
MRYEQAPRVQHRPTEDHNGVLADKIIAITGSTSRKEFVPYVVAYGRPIEDMMRRVPDTERIRKAIGWRPKTSLDQTLRTIVQHYKGQWS